MTEFTPINSQEEFDARIKARLARERERWEKESGVDDLQQQLAAKDEEISSIRRERYLEDARRAVVVELDRRGVDDEGRIQRIMKLVDLEAIQAGEDGAPDRGQVLSQVDGVASDVPELVRPRGAGSGGSRQPVLEREKPLTREEVEAMSETEINEPGTWERVQKFLAGERA